MYDTWFHNSTEIIYHGSTILYIGIIIGVMVLAHSFYINHTKQPGKRWKTVRIVNDLAAITLILECVCFLITVKCSLSVNNNIILKNLLGNASFAAICQGWNNAASLYCLLLTAKCLSSSPLCRLRQLLDFHSLRGRRRRRQTHASMAPLAYPYIHHNLPISNLVAILHMAAFRHGLELRRGCHKCPGDHRGLPVLPIVPGLRHVLFWEGHIHHHSQRVLAEPQAEIDRHERPIAHALQHDRGAAVRVHLPGWHHPAEPSM